MKKKITITWWRLICATICFVLMGVVIGLALPVSASGTSTLTLEPVGDAGDSGYARGGGGSYGDWDTWLNVVESLSPVMHDVPTIGWTERLTPTNNWTVYRHATTFDVSSIPAGAEVTGLTLRFYVNAETDEYAWTQIYGVWAGYPADPDSLVQLDGARWWYGTTVTRISPDLYNNADLTIPGWIEFDIQDIDSGSLSYVTDDSDEMVTFYLMTSNDALKSEPAKIGGSQLRKTIQIDGYDQANKPQLVISYIENTPARTITRDSNAAVDAVTDGTEVADNITWGSPRAGYADEGLYLRVNGDSGASISLELKDEDGNILDSVTDSIRVDGNYDYYTDLPNTWFGWVRLVETNFNILSTWGYQMPSPDSGQIGNTVYAVNTEYPQYDFLFTRYLTYENDAFVLHWKSNIQDGEQADHNLQLYGNGDNTTFYFSQTFDWLNDNYYNSDNVNDHLSHWRYMIFTPNVEGSGFEDYDDMIYDLGKNYGVATSGFIQARILDNTDNTTLADSHSCYWYLPDQTDGFMWNIPSSVRTTEPMSIKLQVGTASQARDNLATMRMQILNASGTSVFSEYESYIYGLNTYEITSPASAGAYEMRFTFSGDGTWSYIHDEPFTVTSTPGLVGVDSWVDVIKAWIVNQGMDNPAGYWAILLIGMVVLFLIAYRSPVMRVVFPLVYLGLMMIWEFIDTWLIILLSLGAGLTLYGIFRKKTGGGNNTDG